MDPYGSAVCLRDMLFNPDVKCQELHLLGILVQTCICSWKQPARKLPTLTPSWMSTYLLYSDQSFLCSMLHLLIDAPALSTLLFYLIKPSNPEDSGLYTTSLKYSATRLWGRKGVMSVQLLLMCPHFIPLLCIPGSFSLGVSFLFSIFLFLFIFSLIFLFPIAQPSFSLCFPLPNSNLIFPFCSSTPSLCSCHSLLPHPSRAEDGQYFSVEQESEKKGHHSSLFNVSIIIKCPRASLQC